MNRSQFIKLGTIGTISTLLPGYAWAQNGNQSDETDQDLLDQLLEANDSEVELILSRKSIPIEAKLPVTRTLARNLAVMSASYTNEQSAYYQAAEVLAYLKAIVSKLLAAQHPNGTVDAGGNRQSPPDTAFLLEYLCPVILLLRKATMVPLLPILEQTEAFVKKAGEALLTGGVHTPNHRWVIAAALARLYYLYGDKRYLNRADQWLADSIYIDADGQFPERSRIYSRVETSALLTIAHYLNRPGLLEIVRKNLVSTYYLMEESGELVTLDSRRQDQYMNISMSIFYLAYRYLAIYQNDTSLAAIARQIEQFTDFDRQVLSNSLIHFNEFDLLCQQLPAPEKLSENYTRLFPLTGMARLKRGSTTATINASNDFPVVIASGRATNPTFFTLRKGEAILEYARLSTSFFNTGYVRGNGLEADGNQFRIRERKEAVYYQPMPAELLHPDGDYPLTESLDGRYWSKMDFENRPVSNLQTLESTINVRENEGEFELDIQIDGEPGTEVTLELCFRDNGQLQQVLKSENDSEFYLETGEYATFTSGTDTIRVGPGLFQHNRTDLIDGEMYSTHRGTAKGKGLHLYFTGFTPFQHTLSLK
ncbi:hypothetical protein [Gaoshiqia sediminis]|uniref:Heparinase II/III-like protein n=1 Tax=Gaoshiqia sediminis TaxID=2986998 RepID=A0AA41YBZ2_9BACT|nr:hypothetical protein [Gaoshiqia sediminis]MCW0482037.1 hypothetical protein [Gaoshiqia sediminis]